MKQLLLLPACEPKPRTRRANSIICALQETQDTSEIQKSKKYQFGEISNDLMETAESEVDPERWKVSIINRVKRLYGS